MALLLRESRRGASVSRVSRGSRAPVALFAAFLLLTGLAWAFSTPPGGGYDEIAHYVKAVGVAGGDLAGSPVRVHAEDRALGRLAKALGRARPAPGPLPPRLAWITRTKREFTMPARLTVAETCVFASDHRCIGPLRRTPFTYARSYVGTYQPFSYLMPGLAARAASSPAAAIRLGRLANLAVSLALLVFAALMLWTEEGGAFPLLGLLAAVTPTVIYCASILNPSGPEIAAGACLAAALVRLGRGEGARVDRPAWAAAALAGSVLALGRSLGPLLVVLVGLTVGLLLGGRRLRSAAARSRGAATTVGVVVLLAAVACWVWEATQQPHPAPGINDLGPGLREVAAAAPFLLRQLVGLFGAFDISLPALAYLA